MTPALQAHWFGRGFVRGFLGGALFGVLVMWRFAA